MASYAEHKREERKRDRHTSRTAARDKRFAGVDGEGGQIITVDSAGVAVPRHVYLLLRAGEETLENRGLGETGYPLSTRECLDFLVSLDKSFLYEAYFFDYDVTMMLKDLPKYKLDRLLDKDCRRVPGSPCSSFPINWGKFQLDYLPKKEFRVRKRYWDYNKGEVKWTPWTIVSDSGTFFQARFTTTLRGWFGRIDPDLPHVGYKRFGTHLEQRCGKDNDLCQWVEERPGIGDVIDKIEEGKEQRNAFLLVDEWEREYNRLECVMLAELMERFREMSYRQNIRPRQWQGPGNLVSAVMKREKLPGNKDIAFLYDEMPDLMRTANDGYYGGRFETGIFGDIQGPVYQYDINSAYADTYRDLPCLLHGKWHRIDHMPEEGIFVGRVSFKHHQGLSYNTLPVRMKKDGVLAFPVAGSGTYWSPELLFAAKHARVWFKDGWKYERQCSCSSFDWVYDIYDERKRMGKDIAGKVLKIVLASTYGKLAQSIGCAPYSNPIWASLIVSTVRATLIHGALSRCNGGSDVVMLATDGIFCTTPRDELPLGGELGQWDLKIHPDMFAVQSGIYFIAGQKPKTRGTPMTRVAAHEHEFRRAWKVFVEGGPLEPVQISVRQFIGLRLANARGKPETAGQWIDHVKEIKFDWISKRQEAWLDGTIVRTKPLQGSTRLESQAYERTIGGIKAEERLMLADQPEWGPQL